MAKTTLPNSTYARGSNSMNNKIQTK